MLVLALFFTAIATLMGPAGVPSAVDERTALWLHAHGHPALTAFLLVITHLHSTAGVLVLGLTAMAVFLRRRQWYWATMVIAVVPVGLLLNRALKEVFQRGRPVFEEPLLTPLTSYSFPSGHAAGATLLYGLLAAYVWTGAKTPAARMACVLGAAAMVSLVAFSRLYLGVHYLSDVLAAICASGAWLVLCLTAGRLFAQRAQRPAA
jgi:undecaprenyl-diphosphatase